MRTRLPPSLKTSVSVSITTNPTFIAELRKKKAHIRDDIVAEGIGRYMIRSPLVLERLNWS